MTVQELSDSVQMELKYNPADVPVLVALEPLGYVERNLVKFLLVPSLDNDGQRVLVIQPIT